MIKTIPPRPPGCDNHILCEYRFRYSSMFDPPAGSEGFYPYKGSPGGFKHRGLYWVEPQLYEQGKDRWWRKFQE